MSKDSIKSNKTILSHLFLKNFSKNDFDKCCKGKDFDPNLINDSTTYDFDLSFFNNLTDLEALLSKKGKKLQQIRKDWASGQQETITIYATPISGKFCSANFHMLGQQRTGYIGKVYIPVSSFKYAEEFWKSTDAQFILKQDFSKLNFSIIPY
jgi:hypothetical protein